MSKLQTVRGTHDLLPQETLHHQEIVQLARSVTTQFGFGEIQTPIFEFTEVFARTLGDASDIVNKEMYTFEDRGGDSVTLRPEGTAGIARAFISHGLQRQLPLKFFYQGPIFRYERPQKGRQRQFHQIGAELLGVETAQADIEMIAMADLFLSLLKFEHPPQLYINTIGDSESRAKYRDELVSFYKDHEKSLSEDSQRRLQQNPLRILDSKDEGDIKINAQAPLFKDSLNSQSKDFYAEVLAGLDALGINYEEDDKLVRGLDYYCHTVFEIKSGDLGAQNTLLAGGRYDGLIEMMGGPKTAGVGWAAGIERLALLTEKPEEIIDNLVVVIPQADENHSDALKLSHELRKAGFNIEMSYSGNMKKRMQRANKMGAKAALLLGQDEVSQNKISIKDFQSGEQSTCSRDELSNVLVQILA